MYSIPQNFKNVLKNRIKILISPILYNMVDSMVDNLFSESIENKYFSLISAIQYSTRELIKKIIISTFEEIDENFKHSAERLTRYYIIKAIAVNNSVNTSQAQSARDISAFTGDLKYFMDTNSINTIPRQSIYNWIKELKTFRKIDVL